MIMQILLYSRFFFPNRSGVPFASHMMGKALSNAGHDVTIYTETLADEEGSSSKAPYRVRRSESWMTLARLSREADLVIVNGGISRKAGMAAGLTRTPIVSVHQMARSGSNSEGWLREAIRTLLVRYADLHVGVSRECLASQNLPVSSETEVIYNPIDPSLLAHNNGKSRKDFDLLFAGRLIEGKGIFVLADALREFDENEVSLSVCVAGHGLEYDRLWSITQSFEFVDVRMPGLLNRPQLARAYASAKCFVIPTSTHQEGSPLVIAEAFAFGLPVIGSDQAVIKEVVGDAGLIFENGDAKDLFEKLNRLLTNDSLRDDLSQKALKRAEIFSFEHFANEITSIVENVAH